MLGVRHVPVKTVGRFVSASSPVYASRLGQQSKLLSSSFNHPNSAQKLPFHNTVALNSFHTNVSNHQNFASKLPSKNTVSFHTKSDTSHLFAKSKFLQKSVDSLRFSSSSSTRSICTSSSFLNHITNTTNCNKNKLCKCSNSKQSFQHSALLSQKSSLRAAESSGKTLPLQLGGRQVQIPLVWLRDHCRCPQCYNAATFQKNVDNYSLSDLAFVEVRSDGDLLSVKWQDGHVSDYSLQWLDNNFYTAGAQVERCLWNASSMNEKPVPSTPYDLHMNSDEGLKNTLRNMLEYGFCVVEGAPPNVEGTLAVTDRISFPLETVYGRENVMVSGEMDHSDTAYTSLPLGAHNDTTYFTIPAGVQVFHCLSHDGEGGKTRLVDGFNAAETLRQDNPEYFRTLASTTVPHEYIEGSNYHLYSLGTVLSTDGMSGALTQIRFNPYDRAPLRTVAPDDIALFYDSYEALTRIIRDPASEFWIKLRPGMVLLVDNWRVMHGRSSFTGKRVVCGLYLPRDDWLSKARVMGLLSS